VPRQGTPSRAIGSSPCLVSFVRAEPTATQRLAWERLWRLLLAPERASNTEATEGEDPAPERETGAGSD
jgi:hypothetical protein